MLFDSFIGYLIISIEFRESRAEIRKKLTHLELKAAVFPSSENNIGDEGATALAAALKENKSLQELYLNCMSLNYIPIAHTVVN